MTASQVVSMLIGILLGGLVVFASAIATIIVLEWRSSRGRGE